MIPVAPKRAPRDFARKVRQPGLADLAARGISLNSPAPKGFKFKACWSESQEQLWQAYAGTCAYLAIYFDYPTGASSTDHFVPKSQHPDLAYEWSNFRLSCLGPNRRKGTQAILDPFTLPSETFHLVLSSGEIKPASPSNQAAIDTIRILDLDSPGHRQMRQKHWQQYTRHKDPATLLELSPFVHFEAKRQGLL